MTPEKLNYVYNYVMDDIEYAESEAVEYAINNLFKINKIAIGTPIVSMEYACGKISGCIKVIEIDLEYHYYFLYLEEDGERHCIDINKEVYHYGDIRRDYVVLYLINYLGLKNAFAYYIHEGYLVRAVRCRGGKIRLKQILSYGIESLNKEAQHAIGNEKPIFDRYKCECGNSIFYIKDETVGMDCPFCSKHVLF